MAQSDELKKLREYMAKSLVDYVESYSHKY